MIKIDHIAIWADDIEVMRRFYMNYFCLVSGEKYVNSRRGFTSYFLSADEGARIELMHIDGVPAPACRRDEIGLAHFAISVGSQDAVNRLTEQLRQDGFTIFSEPRTTGDGYYESAIADPEGNWVEITE